MFIVYATNNQGYSDHRIWLVGTTNNEHEANLICEKLNKRFTDLKDKYEDFWDIPEDELYSIDPNLEFNSESEYQFTEISDLDINDSRKIKTFGAW